MNMFGQNTNYLIKANGNMNFKKQLKRSSIQYCSRIDGFKWNCFFDYNFIPIRYHPRFMYHVGHESVR